MAAPSHTVNISALTKTTCTVSWVRGTGDKVAVFMKATRTGVAAPVNNTTYTANTAFGSGTQIGATGWYCVYNDTGTSVNVTALTAGTAYSVFAVEYTGGAGSETYETAVPIYNPVVFATVYTVNIAMGAAKAADSWSLGAGSDKTSAVAEPDDDNTSYIVSTGAGTSQEFSLVANSIPVGSRITSVKIVRRHIRDGASNSLYTASVFLGGLMTSGGLASATASYATTTSSALIRPGGGDWTAADLTDASVRVTNSNANNTRVTTLYVEVEYVEFVPLRQWQRNQLLLLD